MSQQRRKAEEVIRPVFSGIILAGGRSTRMGTDKRLVAVCGVSLVERILSTVEVLVDEVIVVTHDGPAILGRMRTVPDDVPDRGPLGGLLTGLRRIRHAQALVAPVDMPLLTEELLALLIAGSHGCHITVPRWRGRVEPLVGVYSISCVRHLEQFLRRPSASARDFVRTIDPAVRYVDDADLRPFGDPAVLFFNVNTPADVREAERLLRARKGLVPEVAP